MQHRNMTLSTEVIYKNVKDVGWTPLLGLVCLATTFGTAIPVGYHLGVLNTPAEYIKSWCYDTLIHRYNLDLHESQLEVLWAAIVSVYLVGGIAGSLGTAWICERFGRKGCLLISAVLFVVAGVLYNFCRHAQYVEMLFAGRFFAGLAAALVYTAQPMYLLEIAPSEVRGKVGVFTAIGVTFGIFVAQVCSLHQFLGSEQLWPYALSCFTLVVVVCYVPWYWFPESPRWLYIVRNDKSRARSELLRLRGAENEEYVSQELLEMEEEALAKDSAQKSTLRSVLGNSELWLPLLLVCSLQAGQQLSGINAIFYYSVTIFTKAGFSIDDAEWMNLGAGFMNTAFSAIGAILVSKCNRRPMVLGSCGGCAISMFVLALSLKYIDHFSWLPMTCIACIVLFMLFFELGLGFIPNFIGSELFQVSPRPVAMSMGSLLSWSCNFMLAMFFPILSGVWGSLAFLPCSLFLIYVFLMAMIYLPVSRGRQPSELASAMKIGFKSRIK